MDNSIEPVQVMPYPLEKSDRRHRRRSRPDYSDRRRAPRFLCHFPVSIYVGHGEQQKVYQAMARDISEGGLLLENVDIPETETRLRLQFHIPTGTVPEEYLHGRYTLEAQVAHRDQHGGIGVAFNRTLGQLLGSKTWFYLPQQRPGAVFPGYQHGVAHQI